MIVQVQDLETAIALSQQFPKRIYQCGTDLVINGNTYSGTPANED